jgi:hypothetical protein
MPPTSTNIIRPMSTSGAPGSGCTISPAIVARKVAVIRHPPGDTFCGRGTRYATTR